MPRILGQTEVPTTAPDIVVPWWTDAPWCEPVSGRPVDHSRTMGLQQLMTGDPIKDRVRTSGRTPLQPTGRTTTTVKTWPNFTVRQVPLPNLVWTNGWTNPDTQWFGADQGSYWEVSSLRTGLLGWWAHHVARFDPSQSWSTQLRGGVGGAGIPLWAMIPRLGQLKAGPEAFESALNFVVGGGYSRSTVPWVQKSDGGLTYHPLRAGERLRLTATAYDRLYPATETPDDRCVLYALRFYGAVVNDKTAAEVGHALRLPVGAQVTVPLQLTDFEVLVS